MAIAQYDLKAIMYPAYTHTLGNAVSVEIKPSSPGIHLYKLSEHDDTDTQPLKSISMKTHLLVSITVRISSNHDKNVKYI